MNGQDEDVILGGQAQETGPKEGAARESLTASRSKSALGICRE